MRSKIFRHNFYLNTLIKSNLKKMKELPSRKTSLTATLDFLPKQNIKPSNNFGKWKNLCHLMLTAIYQKVK